MLFIIIYKMDYIKKLLNFFDSEIIQIHPKIAKFTPPKMMIYVLYVFY